MAGIHLKHFALCACGHNWPNALSDAVYNDSMDAVRKNLPVLVSVFIALFIIAVALSFPAGIHAQGQNPNAIVPQCGGQGEPSCNFCFLADLIQNIINFGVYASIFVAVLMFVYAGWLYLINNGDQGKIKKAHDIFLQVLVGVLIVLSSWLVIDTLMKTLVDDSRFGPWNEICGVHTDSAGRVLGPI